LTDYVPITVAASYVEASVFADNLPPNQLKHETSQSQAQIPRYTALFELGSKGWYNIISSQKGHIYQAIIFLSNAYESYLKS